MGLDANPDGRMPASPRLPIRLHERLGDDAMTELLTLFGDLGAETRAEFDALQHEIAALRRDTHAEIAALRQDTHAEIAALRQDTHGEIAAFRQDTRAEFADVKQEIAGLKTQLADFKSEANTKIAGVQSELIKWTFLFWLGTIGIVVLLLRLPG